MDEKIPETSPTDEVRAVDPSPEDQRKFQLAAKIIATQAKLELATVQATSWQATKETLTRSLELSMKELEYINCGQLTMELEL